MKYYIDIDNTITKKNNQDLDYSKALPNKININKVNELYEEGNTIIMWTARGSQTGKNWFEITYKQLNQWGVKFHELRMGKPAFDVFIDDRAYNSIHDWNNNKFLKKNNTLKITNNVSIGDDERCLIIAEVGQNHQGSLEIAKKYIKACHNAGADIVKFQKSHLSSKFNKKALNREYNSVNSFGKTYGEHKQFLEFSDEQYLELKNYAQEIGIIFTASGMDIKSFEFLRDIGCPILKIGSGDTNNLELLEKIAKFNIPLILSTGMNDMESVIKSVNTLFDNGVQTLCLLQCTSSYPLEDKDVNLNVMKSYKEYFGDKIIVGYSGHDKGTAITLGSIALGAKIIEKHVTFDKTWKGSDHSASLDMDELKQLCQDVRRIEAALGSKIKKIQNSELSCINKLGKSLVVTDNLNKGDIINKHNITTKVAEPKGINPNLLYQIIGKKLLNDKLKDDSLFFEDLENI